MTLKMEQQLHTFPSTQQRFLESIHCIRIGVILEWVRIAGSA